VLYGLVWVAYEEFYGSLGLTPAQVGLGQATIVSRVAVFFGVLAFGFVACAGFGVVAYRLTAPVRTRHRQPSLPFDEWLRMTGRDELRSWAKVSGVHVGALFLSVVIPVGVLRAVARGPSLRIWEQGIVLAAALGFELSWLLNDPDVSVTQELNRAGRWLYRGSTPRVRGLLSLSLLGVALAAWATNFVTDAGYAGGTLLSTGNLPPHKVDYLSVEASPAEIVPRGDDPLRVCASSRHAMLLGRNHGLSFVLLSPVGPSDLPSAVVPLDDRDYTVATVGKYAQPCAPKSPRSP